MKRCPICQTTFNDEANFCPMDAGRLVPAGTSDGAQGASTGPREQGLLGGRFKVGLQLGGHHTGEVYQATDTQTGQPCVVKIISPACFPTPMVAQRTERELKQLQKVQSDRVARVLDSGKDGPRAWMALELVNGVTLGEIVQANGPLPLKIALKYAIEVGEALAEAAKVGVIHRDVAPKNILVADGDRVKVLNFSLPTPTSEKVLGIPEFLSPEQAEGRPVDQRSNIYSLGALLYYMLAGEPPFTGEAPQVLEQHVRAAPAAPSSKMAGLSLPEEVERTVLKALEKQSSRRHLTLRQLLGDLEILAAGGVPRTGSSQPPVGAPPLMPRAGVSQPIAPIAAHEAPITLQPKQVPVPQSVPAIAHGQSQPHVNPSTTLTGHAVFGQNVAPVQASNRAEAKTDVMGAQTPPPAVMPQPAAPPPAVMPQPAVPPPAMVPTIVPPPAPVPMAMQATDPAQVPLPVPPPAAVVAPAAPMPPPAVSPPLAAPSAAGAGGKKGRAPAPEAAPKSKKGKFRETMWFKKGELDEAAAQSAATQNPSQIPIDKADELPIEDRYKDDGTISRRDQERLSLKTGHTQMMPVVQGTPAASGGMREADLVKEMSAGRGKLIALVIGAIVLVAAVVIYFTVFHGGEKKKTDVPGPPESGAPQ
jgi:serine/threonine-protein kinase